LILLGVPPLAGYSYITPRRAGLSATAGFLVSWTNRVLCFVAVLLTLFDSYWQWFLLEWIL